MILKFGHSLDVLIVGWPKATHWLRNKTTWMNKCPHYNKKCAYYLAYCVFRSTFLHLYHRLIRRKKLLCLHISCDDKIIWSYLCACYGNSHLLIWHFYTEMPHQPEVIKIAHIPRTAFSLWNLTAAITILGPFIILFSLFPYNALMKYFIS